MATSHAPPASDASMAKRRSSAELPAGARASSARTTSPCPSKASAPRSRLGAARAEQMILSGRSYSADELYDLGIVHALADPGKGRAEVESYIRQNRRRHSGHCAIYEASRSVNPLALGELEAVVDLWADAALRLSDADLKLMRRLVGAQTRLLEKAQVASC